MSKQSAIAMSRFGLGARLDQEMPANPKSWLIGQIEKFEVKPAALANQPTRREIAAAFGEYRVEAKAARAMRKTAAPQTGDTPDMSAESKKTKHQQPKNMARKIVRNFYTDAVDMRLQAGLSSANDFAERLVYFWSNHFAISIDKLPVVPFAGNYEFDAIRPHIMGRFGDMLSAAVTHPAMLLFLDQAQSIGPNSMLAQRIATRRKKELGLNENLAREILELHTLGVRTGYTQGDVTEFARALTGMTVAGIGDGPLQKKIVAKASPGDSLFLDVVHEPGKRQIMGKTYSQSGQMQSAAILADLAVHSATARHIATKLAQHFVADTPPPTLVAKLEQNFLKTGGDLPSLYRTLIEAPEAWSGEQQKFKSPWEWVISSLRALNIRQLPGNANAVGMFEQMGQPVWKPGSPAGFADTTDNWAGGAALMRRVEMASRFAERSASHVDARKLGTQILPDILSAHSIEAISRADSPAQGIAMLLVSPEFLRR